MFFFNRNAKNSWLWKLLTCRKKIKPVFTVFSIQVKNIDHPCLKPNDVRYRFPKPGSIRNVEPRFGICGTPRKKKR